MKECFFFFSEKDVNRTDRNHPFFEGEHNPNVTLLHDILMTYVMYNFDLGYVQGMSDLLAPILYVTQHEATAFWCFVGYMNMVVSVKFTLLWIMIFMCPTATDLQLLYRGIYIYMRA